MAVAVSGRQADGTRVNGNVTLRETPDIQEEQNKMKAIGASLIVAVAGLILAQSAGAEEAKAATKIVMDGSTTVGPLAKAFAEYYMSQHSEVSITVSESGSGNGAKSMVNGTCQIANMSRFMKPEEFKAAADKGLMPTAHVIAVDGIVLIVHSANPVKEFSKSQIKDIYTGKVTNWNQVGGPDAKIVKISRDTNSGTYETFESLVMKGEKMVGDVEYVGSNGAIRQRVQSTPAAIGYVGLAFADRTVKAVPVDGVRADQATIASGRYPIARPLYMFTNGYPALGTPLHALVTLHLSKKGQSLVEAVGFVPVTNYGAAGEEAKSDKN
jgi:phosphate transport system substrate-binding protein